MRIYVYIHNAALRTPMLRNSDVLKLRCSETPICICQGPMPSAGSSSHAPDLRAEVLQRAWSILVRCRAQVQQRFLDLRADGKDSCIRRCAAIVGGSDHHGSVFAAFAPLHGAEEPRQALHGAEETCSVTQTHVGGVTHPPFDWILQVCAMAGWFPQVTRASVPTHAISASVAELIRTSAEAMSGSVSPAGSC